MRRIVFGAAVVLGTLGFGLAAIAGCLLIPNGNPLIWMARPWARLLLAASGTPVSVTGRERIPRGSAVIYVTNHQSHVDVLALMRALPGQFRMVAKKELFAIPVFGWAIALAGFVKIDRADREKAFRSLDTAAERLRRGRSIVIFAEGTRSPDGRLQPFKKGAFVLALRTGTPIVPVSLSGSRAVLARNSLDVRKGAIDVVFGSPIPVTGYTLETKEQLMARVREAVLAGFTRRKILDEESPPPGAPRPAAGV